MDGLILSSNACAELAEGVTIDPDPASLGLGVTIHILGSTGGLVIPDTLVGITISDASGATIRGYGWEALTFPDGVTASSGNGWEWTETFDSGEPGRWTVRVEYLTAGADRKSQDGSFCVNDDQPGQASSSQSGGSPITGRVVAPPLADETPAADPTPAESASQPTLVPPSEPAPSVPAGELLWRYQTDGAVDSSPTVANGVAYVGSVDGHLYALDAGTGAILWSYKTGNRGIFLRRQWLTV